jgi:hypothetical protein
MKTATTYIAESMIKAVGVAGIEAMAMKNAIYSIWRPLAEELADEIEEVCFNYEDDDIRVEYVDSIFTSFRNRMSVDFVERALPYVEEYAGYAWDRGREDAFGYALAGLLPLQKDDSLMWHEYDNYDKLFAGFMRRREMPDQPMPSEPMPSYPIREYKYVRKDQESIITELVSLTGSTKANVQRTVKRWFRTTQGQYFDRFIVPETARLLSYEEGVSLREIGKNYKKFVKGEAYWSGVSEFNAETSKVFAQVQSLHEMNVTEYTIQAILDDKTCDVCRFLHGTTWSVEEAVTKVYDLIISEADSAADINPFPPRSTPKDFDDPHESPYNLPPYHPRCRCNIRTTTKVTAMPQEVLARPFDAGPRPTDKLLNKIFSQYIQRASASNLDSNLYRALTNAEWKVAREAWESMPFEVKKWASRNNQNFNLYIRHGDDVTSRVIGNNIEMNARFFDPKKYGPQPLQHELRHALVNREAIASRGGADTIWRELSEAAEDAKKGWRSPTHVNTMYQVNGNRGLQAASAASDEFLAMVGDYYRPDMPMDELIAAVRHKEYGINVSDKIGSTLVSSSPRWSAKEAKNAVSYWWYVMDIDNNTLLSKKQMLAKMTYKPSTTQIRAIAIRNEVNLRDTLRAAGVKQVYQEGDNAPFDVWVGADPAKYYAGTSKKKPWAVIEVKTIVRSDNDKITMHKASLARKKKEYRKFGTRKTSVHTVVFDERTGKYYYRDDIGSFRLSAMKEVELGDIQEIFGGKSTIARAVELPDTTERLATIQAVSPKVKTKPTSSVNTKSRITDDNINEVRIVTVGKGKKKYIFKPIEGESYFNDFEKDSILKSVNGKFKTKLTRLEDLTDEHWEYAEGVGFYRNEQMVRSTITNHEVSLAQREVFALDVAQRLGLDNDYAIVPKFMIAEDADGNIAGILMEFIDDAVVDAKWTGEILEAEQNLQMSAFDYLIGNLDRHESNWLRKTSKVGKKRVGTPVYIDHGYCMPGQDMDLGGLSELRLMQATQAYPEMEFEVDPDFGQNLATRIQKFVDEEAIELADKYGFSPAEVDAMIRRGDSVAERLRGGTFGQLLIQHDEEFGVWGLEDSYIGG